MTTIEIVNALRQLAKTPTAVYALQSNNLVLSSLGDANFSLDDLNAAFRQISSDDPSFALKYILEPFTYAFSTYLKEEHPVCRWPTTTEVAKVFKALNEHRLCPKFMEKRTRLYTIRKIISSIPEWHSSMSKGVRKRQARIQNVSSLIDPFIAYVERQYIAKSVSDPDVLRSFCGFVLSELSLTQSEVESALVEQLLKRFKTTQKL